MFNLFNFGDELTLPEQVEQNKQNIELLAEEVEKLGFSPRGEYDATAEYVKNDLVFYDGKMYAVKSDVAVVGVVPTNTEYWQQITGDVRGQAGAPGAPGAQGEKGDDGADGLTFTGYFIAQQPPVYLSERYFTNTLFNRTPKVNDTFVAYYKVGDTVYLTMYRVLSVDSTQAYCRLYLDPILLNGEKGETGEIALVYDQNINAGTLDPEQSEQLLNVVLPFANFNRTPALNEDFVGVLVAQNIEYLAQCEVQSIIGSNVVSIVVSGVKRLTGEPGRDGTNGTNGRDALQMTYKQNVSAVPEAAQTLVIPDSAFNRSAQPNDVFTMIADYSSANRSFICIVRVDNEVGGGSIQWNCTILSVVETTGQAGALNGYSVSFSLSTATNRQRLNRICNGAKSVIGTIQITIDGQTYDFNATDITANYSSSMVLVGCSVATASEQDNSAVICRLLYINGNISQYSHWTKIKTDGTITSGSSVSPVQAVLTYYNDTEIA